MKRTDIEHARIAHPFRDEGGPRGASRRTLGVEPALEAPPASRANTGWGTMVDGIRTLDLGGADAGRNSLLGNTLGAVSNNTSEGPTVEAIGNWWARPTPTRSLR